MHKPTAADVGALSLGGGAVTGDLSVGNAKKFTITSANTSALNASLRLWGSGDRATVIEFGDASGYHYYSQRTSNNTVEFRTVGQITPGNYANFDARYQLKTGTVQQVRLGAAKDVSNGSGNLADQSGYVVTMGGDFGSSDGYYRLRPVQYLINGTWHNAVSA